MQATDRADSTPLPTAFTLGSPYPNPAASIVTVPYATPEATRVTLAVYDMLGRCIAVLVDEHVVAGYHETGWQPRALPSGLYFVRLDAGPRRFVRKITVID